MAGAFRRNGALASVLCLVQCVVQSTLAGDSVEFNRDIRPILAAACLKCHGQDAGHRQADLRLDDPASATAARESGVVVAAGDPAASLLWQRIHSSDPELVMPPPDSVRQLSGEEKEKIKQWIEQGGNFQNHWAFEPISKPETRDPGASLTQQIDHWIQEEADKRGLPVLGLADPRIQIRRLAFALTGLPPDPDDAKKFAEDPSDVHYARWVDHYMDSPHYGEEMARHWLDVARYGDTHGLHLDNDRRIWPYRDWVIRAFQQNLPFDRFTIEQLAGDLLPNPTQDQLVATGFNRCNVTTSEGGAIEDEFLFRYAVDRASTTIQAWLGLTGGCAVCHDHKYDPLTAREFYSIYSFFYSNADPAMDGNIQTTAPFIKLPTAQQKTDLEKLDREIAESIQQLGQLAGRWSQQVDAVATSSPRPATHLWLDDQLPMGANQRNTSRNAAQWTQEEATVPVGLRAIVTEFGDRLEQVISGGTVPRWILNEATVQLWLKTDANEPPDVAFLEVRTDKGNRRWFWGVDAQAGSKIGANPNQYAGPLPAAGHWQLISLPAEGLTPGALVQELQLGVFGGIAWWDGLAITGQQAPEHHWRRDWTAWWNLQKGKNAPLAEGPLLQAIQQGPDSEAGKKELESVKRYFFSWVSDEVPEPILQLRARIERLQVRRAMLEDSIPGTMIYKDRDPPRQAHVMLRGQYDAKGEPVEPGGMAFLPPIATQEPQRRLNRLDLAQWITAPNNPLTARVAVNRFWQQIFGTGIVLTSDDFGTQGTPPTHPELLDAMASHFVENGWNVRELLRSMVLTKTFRREGTVTAELTQKDPANRYLSRGPRLRLDAEQIRDNALAVSGLLNRQIGGPGFRGYQPPSIWEPVGYGDSNTRYYLQEHGDVLYRRSIYAYVKRTAPPPFMTNFDAPNRETFCTRRERSNTPLQALQLLNDVQHFEASRCLAESLVKETLASPDRRLELLFERVLARQPDAFERESISKFLEETTTRLAAAPEEASKIARAGQRWPDRSLPTLDVAVWTLASNLVLNLDETITRN